MPPNHSQNQPTIPASLPAVSSGLAQPGTPSTNPALRQVGTDDRVAHNIAQAKQLVLRYGNDPFKLSEALNQLKVAYLAEQYNITVNQAEN